MKPEQPSSSLELQDEIAELITTLHATEKRLVELTHGEVDTVASDSGQPFLLRRAQQELRTSEAHKQAAILDALPSHIALVDPDGVIVSVNRAWRRRDSANSFQGPDIDVGHNYLEICERAKGADAVAAGEVARGIRAVLAGQDIFTREYTCQSHLGAEPHFFEVTVTPLPGGSFHGALVMHLNITVRKQAEVELQGKTAFLEAQLGSTIDGILVVDAQGRKILQNQRLTDLFNIPRHIVEDKDDNTQRLWVTGVTKHPRQFAERIAFLNAHRDEVGRDEIELKNGKILDRYSAPVVGNDGKYFGRIWTFRDITERLQGINALRESEHELRHLAERLEIESARLVEAQAVAKVGSWETDVDKLTVLWSDENHRIFETDPATFTPTQSAFLKLVHPDDRLAVDRAFTASLSHGAPCVLEHRLLLPGGRIKYVEERWRSHSSEAGRSARVFGICRDITERRLAEAALRESNEKFHQLADNISDAFWIRSPDMSEVQYVSPAFEKIWGRTVASLQANPHAWNGFIFPADRPRVEAAFAGLTGNTPSLDLEYRIVRPDGELRWIRVRGSQIRNEEDHLVRHVGIVTDITAQREVRESLRQTQELLTVASALARSGAWSVKLPELTLSLSDGARQIHEMPVGFEPTVQQALDYYVPKHRDRIAQAFEVCLRNGTPFDLELEIVTSTGRRVWVRSMGKAEKDEAGVTRFIRGSIQDISRNKEAELALRASQQRFKALFDQAAVGVAISEVSSGRFVQVNQRFAEITAYRREELEQLRFAEITHPQDLERDQTLIQELWAGKRREFTKDKRYVRKDGTEVWVNLTVSAMWGPGEAPTMCIAVVQDITGRKQLEEQIRQAQKMEAIGTLAGGIAHDFNNILAAISGYTELARMTLTGNAGPRAHLDAVMLGVKRAVNLVRQILTFSRQEALERKPIDLHSVVVETFELLRATIPTTIEFDLALATDAPVVLADPTQVHQILMNLGTNAWHAMRDGTGRLTVRLEPVVVDAALVAAQPQLHLGHYARITIRDTGMGMSPATVSRIFEPFFTTKAPGDGTGLGLAVVHGIMDNHYGAITVESEPGVGTTFCVYFPAHAGAASATTDETLTVSRGHGERILVVDDEHLLAEMTQQALIALGYESEFVTTPEAALALVRADAQRFALVLTDLTMPGMTGLILADQLRQIRPDLPIILLTGYSASLTVASVKAAGLQDLLLKPATIQSLGLAVHAALSSQPQA